MPAAEQKKFRAKVGAMFQDPVGSLSPRMTIRSLLAEPFNLENAVGGEKDVQAIDLDSVIKKCVARPRPLLSGIN